MSNRLTRRIVLPLLAFAVLIPFAFAQQKSAQASDDVVLSAMRAELDRSKSQLKMEQVAAPYYVEYRIFDLDQYSAEASYGALRIDMRSRMRFVRVVVRIGDYKQDSYFGQGQGTVDYMPLDNDMLALRHQLWLGDRPSLQVRSRSPDRQAIAVEAAHHRPAGRRLRARRSGAIDRAAGHSRVRPRALETDAPGCIGAL